VYVLFGITFLWLTNITAQRPERKSILDDIEFSSSDLEQLHEYMSEWILQNEGIIGNCIPNGTIELNVDHLIPGLYLLRFTSFGADNLVSETGNLKLIKR
jgi:hypothetical protein